MSSSNSLLLSDIELKGKITEKDDIILGCKFDGNIVANKVNLSETATINGDINANEIEVNGKTEKLIPREVAYNVVSEEPKHIHFMRIVSGKESKD